MLSSAYSSNAFMARRSRVPRSGNAASMRLATSSSVDAPATRRRNKSSPAHPHTCADAALPNAASHAQRSTPALAVATACNTATTRLSTAKTQSDTNTAGPASCAMRTWPER